MTMPPNVMSSGWHLHQSLRDRHTGANAFMADEPTGMSATARYYLAGLLTRARIRRIQHANHQRLPTLSAIFAGA
jgi:glutamine synthetase